jgi:hypothetical protein
MDRLHRYGAAGRVHLCRAKDWCCPNSIEAVRIARLLAERRAQNLGLNKQNSSRFFVTSGGVPLCRQKLRAVHMPERVICRNGTNSSEIVRENVGARFRSLRHTFQFAGVRWATLAYVGKFDRGSALSAIRSSSLEYAGLPTLAYVARFGRSFSPSASTLSPPLSPQAGRPQIPQ